MTKNKKLLIGVGIGVLLCVIAIGIYREYQEDGNDEVINIGVLSFLTGNYANIGHDLIKGASVFLDDRELCDKKVVLSIEDGKGAAKDSLIAVRKLLQKKPVAMIVAGDYQVPAVSAILNESKIPSIATIVGNGSFLKENAKKWVFRDWLPISSIAATMAKYVVSSKKYRKIAILYIDSEWGHEALNALNQVLENKIEIVGVQSYTVDVRDLRPQIASLLSKEPEAVYLSGYGPSYISAVNQLREVTKIDIITETSINNPETKRHIKDFSNIIFSDSTFNLEENESGSKFREQYYKKYGEYPTIYAAFGYDAMHLLLTAIDNSDGSNVSIQTQLKATHNFTSLNGEVTFLPNGDCHIQTLIRQMDVKGNPSTITQKN